MRRLLQIAGFPGSTTVHTLVEFIQPLFTEEKLLNVWLDPYSEPRAVAFFDCDLEEKKLRFLRNHKKLLWEDCELTVEIVQPTSSIFIRTYGATFGAIDKLAYLFSFRQTRTVKEKKKLDEDCYEISFNQSWDAVVEVCRKEWFLGKIKLTVRPYFDCFKEPLVDLYEQDLDQEELDDCGSKKEMPHHLHSNSCSPTREPRLSYETVQSKFTKEELDSNFVSTQTKTLQHNDKTLVCFQHSFTPLLLKLLQFNKATDEHDCHLNFTNDNGEVHFEIEGPTKIVKSISKMLQKEDYLMNNTEPRNYFFALGKVQKELKDHLKLTQCHVILIDTEIAMHLEVSVSGGKKLPFQEFVSSLVVVKEFTSLLKVMSEESKECIDLFKQFNESYSYRQIYAHKFDVTYISLAFKINDLDFLVNLTNNQLKGIEMNQYCCQESKTVDGSIAHVHQNENVTQENRIPQSLFPASTQAKDPNFESYIVQDAIYLMLFGALNLKQAIENTCNCLKLQENDTKLEMTPTSAEASDILKSIKKQFDKIALRDYEERFLKHKGVQEHILSDIKESGIHFVIDKLHKEKLLVQTKANNRELFQDYLKSLMVLKNCNTLPRKSCKQSRRWQKFIKSFNKEHSICQVYVRDDLNVILLLLNSIEEDMDLVDEINSAISLLTQVEEGDEDNLLEKANLESKLSVSASKDSAKQSSEVMGLPSASLTGVTKMTLVCQTSFFVWLLYLLEFKYAFQRRYPEIYVKLIPEKSEILIKSSSVNAGNVKSTLLDLERTMPFTNEEEDFLNTETVKKTVESKIRKHSWQIKIVDDLKLLVTNDNGNEKTFTDFALRLFKRVECMSLPNIQLQFFCQWTSFVEEFHFNNPQCHIMVNGVAVTLLTACTPKDMKKQLVKHINDNIERLISVKNLDRLENQTKLDQVSVIEPDTETFSLPMAKIQHDYCKMFRMDDFKNLKERYQQLNAHIELSDDSFEIKCHPSMINSIKEDLKQLKQIEHEDKHLCYPGLLPFIKSQDGKRLLENITETWRCLIELPGMYTSKQHQHVETLEQDSVRPDYRAVLIRTAKCNGFKIHLIEGYIEDIDSEMTVKFFSSQQGKASIKSVDSSLRLSVFLPQWKVPTGENITYLKTLRESFKDVMALVIHQALHHECANLAFSTQNIHSAEHPFPLDCLADIITKVLGDLLSQVPHHSASSAAKEINVFICEPKCEAVFKAFTYFAKNVSASFGPPDQDVWDNLCAPNISKYPNYRKIPVAVEVTNINPFEFERKSLFCYPILPSLDSASCPVILEPTVSKRLLEESIKEVIDKYPDGLLINQHFRAKCFHSPRDVIVYCSPEWGLDSSKTIYGALERCLSLASEVEAVYIVPPGLPLPTLSTYQKYPAKYLAITLFQALDRLFEEKKINKQKKIVFVVGNTKYEEVFKMELQRRYPQNSEKQQEAKSFFSVAYIKNFFSGGSEKKGPKPDTAFMKTKVPKIPVSFYCQFKENIYKAAETLDQELRNLMSKNTKMVELDKNETASFEERIQNMKELNISFILERNYEEGDIQVTNNKKKKKRRKSKQKRNKTANQNQGTENKNLNTIYILTGSSLKIQGLCGKFVEEFENAALSLSVKCKKHFADVNQATDSDESNETYYSDEGSESGLNNLQQGSSSVDPFEKAESNKAGSAIFQKEGTCPKKTSFEWKYESEDASKGTVFVPFEKEITESIEQAYVDENLVFNIDGESVIVIDFSLMQATVDRTGAKRKVIRSEILEAQSTTALPITWKSTDKELYLLDLKDSNAEFKCLQEHLSKDLDTQEHKVQIIKVERVQNPCLYKRTQSKLKLLELTKSPSTLMWRRVFDETRLLVCQYGFHPALLSATTNENLGDGVLFHTDAQRFLEEKDMTDGRHICLISSSVNKGLTGPGRIGLRAPPLDEAAGLPCHSVTQDGDCMIFSDAQVYPCHSVIFKMQKQMSATAPEFFPKTK